MLDRYDYASQIEADRDRLPSRQELLRETPVGRAALVYCEGCGQIVPYVAGGEDPRDCRRCPTCGADPATGLTECEGCALHPADCVCGVYDHDGCEGEVSL